MLMFYMKLTTIIRSLKMMKIFKNLPFQLLICIFLAILTADYFDHTQTRFAFTLSCLLKEILVAVLPFVILSYISTALMGMQQKAPLLILFLLGFVFISNFICAIVAFEAGTFILPLITKVGAIKELAKTDDITPLFSLNLPTILAPQYAMIAGLIVGLILSFRKNSWVQKVLQNNLNPQAQKSTDFVLSTLENILVVIKRIMTLFLKKFFIPVLPIYVFGFVLKMKKEDTLSGLAENYGQVFLFTCILFAAYVVLFHFVSTGFKARETLKNLKNLVPAMITGFSTMSSAATMPLTLSATIKNTGDEKYSQLVVPLTVSMHAIADSLGIPIMALAIMVLSGVPLPSLQQFIVFAFYFVIARYSTAGIPGGGVLVSTPMTAAYLGLTPEMNMLLTTLYFLHDPVITVGNVVGVSGFGVLTRNIARKLGLIKSELVDVPNHKDSTIQSSTVFADGAQNK